VRDQDEWDRGHLSGALHMPYHDIHEFPADIDAARPVAVICSSGQRSAVAASLLQRLGAQHVIHVADGGVEPWGENGWPLDRPDTARAVA
jgi:hydroxyacylglutathione hydrolase